MSATANQLRFSVNATSSSNNLAAVNLVRTEFCETAISETLSVTAGTPLVITEAINSFLVYTPQPLMLTFDSGSPITVNQLFVSDNLAQSVTIETSFTGTIKVAYSTVPPAVMSFKASTPTVTTTALTDSSITRVIKYVTKTLGTPEIADSVPLDQYRSAYYSLQVYYNGYYQISDIIVVQDGTNVWVNEINSVSTSGAALATFDVQLAGPLMQLLVTAPNPGTQVKAVMASNDVSAFTNIVAMAGSVANLSSGAAGSLPYQSGPSITSLLPAGTSSQVLVSGATPSWTNTPTLTGTNFSGVPVNALVSNTVTIGTTSIFLGTASTTLTGLTSVSSTNFTGAFTGALTGVASGNLPLTGGTLSGFLNLGGFTPTNSGTPVNPNDLVSKSYVDAAAAFTSGTGINVVGKVINNTGVLSVSGTANQINASTVSGATTLSLPSAVTISGAMTAASFIGSGASLSGTAPSLSIGGTAALATSVAGGAANQLVYQTGAGVSNFVPTANYGVLTTGATGVPAVTAGAAGVLVGSASAVPSFTTAPTLTGTNFTGIANTALTNSSVTIGSTAVSLGATATTLAGLTSVSATTLTGNHTGTGAFTTLSASGQLTSTVATGTAPFVVSSTTPVANLTAALATSLAGGAANQLHYQTAAGVSGFVNTANYGVVTTSSTGVPQVTAGAAGVLVGSAFAVPAFTTTLTGLTSVSATTFTGALTGNASTATTLQTAQNISIASGDGTTGAVTFNGSAPVALAFTLATVNASPVIASFQKVTTNAKGLVTATSAVVPADITTALGYTPVSTTGSSLTGTLTFDGTHTITGLPTPVNASDAAPKSYVDSSLAGLTWKSAVAAASTANLTATYSNGASGVGATLTNAGALATFVIDGYTALLNDRILIKNQTTAFQNGIYTVTTVGSASVAWVLTRSTDQNTSAAFNNASVNVNNGTVNIYTSWTQTALNPTIGTTAITFVQFSGGSATYTAGTGISLAGNIVTNLGVTSLTGTANQITVSASTGAVTLSLPTTISGLTSVSATTFTGALTGNANTATNVAGGVANQLHYQTGASTTGFVTTANYGVVTTSSTGVPQVTAGAAGVLVGSASAVPTWSTTPTLTGTNFTGIPNTALTNSSVTVGSTAIALGATATTIAGLTALTATTLTGTLATAAQPNITSVGTLTGLTVTGTISGSINGTAVGALSATNVAGGAANQLHYQTAASTTGFVPTANYGVVTTGPTGAPAVTAGAAGVLVGSASAIPAFSTTPTLTGTNFTGIPNTGLTNSSVTIGSTAVTLGATATALAGLTSVNATTLTGTLATAAQPNITSVGTLTGLTVTGTITGSVSGNANTATNVAGGVANQLHYQTGASTTGFITAPSVASTYLQWTGSAFAWVASGGAASGANSDITSLSAITSINSGSLSGSRNRIINGDFKVSQRATSGTTGTGLVYVCDRWQLASGGTGNAWSQTTNLLPGSVYVNVLQITGSATATSFVLSQKIESLNCRDMAGQSVTLSYWVYQTTGASITPNDALSYANSTDVFTSTTLISSTGGVTIPTSTWTQVVKTFTVPAAATTGLMVSIFYGAGPTLAAGQSVIFANVQLELGTKATLFEFKSVSDSLKECYRYAVPITLVFDMYATVATQTFVIPVSLPVPMRTATQAITFLTNTVNTNINFLGPLNVSNLAVSFNIITNTAGLRSQRTDTYLVTAEFV